MTGLLIRGISNEAASVLDPFSTLVDYQLLAALAFSTICIIPYLSILIWLLSRGPTVSQVLLARF